MSKKNKADRMDRKAFNKGRKINKKAGLFGMASRKMGRIR